MAVPAMTDLDRFLTGSSRAGRPCQCLVVANFLSPRWGGTRYPYLWNHVLGSGSPGLPENHVAPTFHRIVHSPSGWRQYISWTH